MLGLCLSATYSAHALEVSNGRIVYNRVMHSTYISSIHSMQGNGTGDGVITAAPSSDYDALMPVWSPNGQKVAFSYFGYNVGDPDNGGSLKVSSATNGATALRLATNARSPFLWSPDSTYIYYGVGTSQVYRIRADGSGVAEKVLDPGHVIRGVDLSPDGSTLLYTSPDSVYTKPVTSSTVTKLVGPLSSSVYQAYWSPDGSKAAYRTVTGATTATISVVNTDGSNNHAVTAATNQLDFSTDTRRVWSPDGSKLLYRVSTPQAGTCQTMGLAPSNLHVTDAISGTSTALTNTTSAQHTDASWSPDGQLILYATWQCVASGSTHLFTMAPNGNSPTDLTPTETEDALYPSWETVIAPSATIIGDTTNLTIAPTDDMSGRSVTVPTNTILSNNGTAGDITVLSGGTLMGSGTNGDVSVASGGTLAPGNSPGCTTTGNLLLSSGATYDYQVGSSTACTGYDQVQVTGSVTVTGAVLSVSVLNNFAGAPDNVYEIISNDGTDAVVGTFAGLPEGSTVTVGNLRFTISYTGGTGNDITLTQQDLPVTAPSPQLANTGTSLTRITVYSLATILLSLLGIIAYCARRATARL